MSALHHGLVVEQLRPKSELLNHHTCLGLYSTDIFTAQFYATMSGFYGDARRITDLPCTCLIHQGIVVSSQKSPSRREIPVPPRNPCRDAINCVSTRRRVNAESVVTISISQTPLIDRYLSRSLPCQSHKTAEYDHLHQTQSPESLQLSVLSTIHHRTLTRSYPIC